MGLNKRQYYGFNGFQFPSVPRARRSIRGRGLRNNKFVDGQICAFELLASLAGKLLQESQSSYASSNASEANDQHAFVDEVIKQELHEDNRFKTECVDQGSCEESVYIPEFAANSDQKLVVIPNAESDSILERSSIILHSDSSDRTGCELNSVTFKSKTTSENFLGKVEGGSADHGESCNGYTDNEFSRKQGADLLGIGGSTIDNACSLKDSKDCRACPALINSNSNVKLSSSRDPVPNAFVLGHRNNCKLGIRDDDEKFSRCNRLASKPKAFRPSPRSEDRDRRIRKLLTSRYWKVAPKLKDCELSKVAFLDGGVKSLYRKRKIAYSRERYQHDKLYKRRKLSNRSLFVTSDGGLSSESVCNSPQKGMTMDKNSSGSGVSSSVLGHQASFHAKDSHVKFSIKSFRVPELFIEAPETATVGSLKKTVMEAVTAILGSGLRVGVVLQGKKVRDDNRTLQQTGLTCKEKFESLGFTLEPSTMQVSSPLCTEDPSVPLQCGTSQLILRSPATSVLDSAISDSGLSDALPDPLLTNSVDNVENNLGIVSFRTDILTDKTLSNSRALVAAPPVRADTLAVVPLNQKSRRSELVQRRTRRPFSVTEVEALVTAVEELGTGRWRDVKLRSFESADHRTYVDLKDKWKTLVHTAKIAPQQRRGEPVPQELLDRVLTANAYWSRHQAKQQSKNQAAATLNLPEAPHAITNGVEGIHLL